VLCQSIEPKTAAELASRIRRDVPLSRILRVRSGRPDHDHLANLSMSIPVEPSELIRGVEMLAESMYRPVSQGPTNGCTR
jgi:hypothetical protein